MYKAIAAGTRVIWNGQEGTVRFDSSETWRTASIEFDDDKSVIVQKEKSELTILKEVGGVWVAKQSALASMVEKLDKRPRGHLGYVTQRDELISILSELSPLVSVAILEENREFNQMRGDKEISVEIKLGFTLERDLL